MEIQSLVRENRGLQGNLLLVQQGLMEGVNEVNRLKEMVAQNERGGFNLRNQSDQYQRDS